MIQICVPGLTTAQLAIWVLNKPVPIQSFSAGLYDPAVPLSALAGQVVQFLVDDSHWPEARIGAASLAVLAGLQRVRVCFDSIDQSQVGGRPVGCVAWVYADGHQGEA